MNNETPPTLPQAQAANPPGSGLVYAGFWHRLGAYGIDTLVLLPLIGLSLWLKQNFQPSQLYYIFPSVLFGLFFHVWLVQRYGGTPGKLALKMKIVRLDGSAVGYREAFVRHSVQFFLPSLVLVAKLIGMSDSNYIPLSFDAQGAKIVKLSNAYTWSQYGNFLLNIWIWSEFVVMLTNKKRRAFQDFMAGTVVVRTA